MWNVTGTYGSSGLKSVVLGCQLALMVHVWTTKFMQLTGLFEITCIALKHYLCMWHVFHRLLGPIQGFQMEYMFQMILSLSEVDSIYNWLIFLFFIYYEMKSHFKDMTWTSEMRVLWKPRYWQMINAYLRAMDEIAFLRRDSHV